MTDKMNEMLTDKELDSVVGGATDYRYFKVTISAGPYAGREGYKVYCTEPGFKSTKCILADKFDLLKSLCISRGDTFTEGSAGEYDAMKKSGKAI